MKILQLTAENIKRLSVVEITPDGNVIQITGKNGQGKTSVLDAIWWALCGADHIQSKPIRDGETSARIALTLGDNDVEFSVERRFTESNSYLTVKTVDGAKYPSPQKLLDDLIGELTFDPLEFMRMKPGDQVAELQTFAKLDFSDLDAADEDDREQRKLHNAHAKRTELQLRDIQPPPDDLPKEEVSLSALNQKLQAAVGRNGDILDAQNTRQRSLDEQSSMLKKIEQLESEIEGLRSEIDTETKIVVDAEKRLSELGDPIDLHEIQKQIETAEATNQAIRDAGGYHQLIAENKAESAASEKITERLKARKNERRERIAAAELPVTGLAFEDGRVTFENVPLDQSSDAQQLAVSCAMAVAMNPKLRVLRIRDGSLLDEDSMAWLAKFAEHKDFQIWIERVDSSGTVGIVMEDGHVKGAPPVEKTEDAS